MNVLEQNALGSQDIAQTHFPKELINKDSFSKGAKRNFEYMRDVLQALELGPRSDMLESIESTLKQSEIESLFYKTRIEEAQLKID